MSDGLMEQVLWLKSNLEQAIEDRNQADEGFLYNYMKISLQMKTLSNCHVQTMKNQHHYRWFH